MTKQFPKKNIHIATSARLHMGFFDLNGSSGRRFGSLGLSLKQPNTAIELAHGGELFSELLPAYIDKAKHTILAYTGIKDEVSIKSHAEIPRHAGLGSGTQMALAVGVGISRLFNLKLTLEEIALIIGRGLRSGIGIGTFASGGLVLDGGRGKNTEIPPIIASHHFPSSWRILLMLDNSHIGMHGAEEKKAFSELEDADLASTKDISHAILMQALPALAEENLIQFGQAIAKLQSYTGDYFAPVQNGRYASEQVSQVLNYLIGQGVYCVGQSSWGPTGFAVFENQEQAERYCSTLQQKFQQTNIDWVICEANNSGAVF